MVTFPSNVSNLHHFFFSAYPKLRHECLRAGAIFAKACAHLTMLLIFLGMCNTPRQIIAKLGQPGFTVNLSEVCDGRTRGLLEGLLDLDPKKRLRYFDSPISRLALL